MKTVLEVIQATTGYFTKNGIEQPRLNIELLLAHVLNKARMELYLEFDRPISDAELDRLRELVKRRAAREPLQHLLGTSEFFGRTFQSDKRALIPRPETEQLCEMVIREIKKYGKQSMSVLDVGTGSGVIAVTLALELPGSKITALDLSAAALALAIENARAHSVDCRLTFVQSDLLTAISGQHDVIVANLPYVRSAEILELEPEVRFDPSLALDGGIDGTEVIARLIRTAGQHLNGLLALEIGPDQGAYLSSLLSEHNYHDIRVLPDYQGRNRFVLASYG